MWLALVDVERCVGGYCWEEVFLLADLSFVVCYSFSGMSWDMGVSLPDHPLLCFQDMVINRRKEWGKGKRHRDEMKVQGTRKKLITLHM